MSKQTMYWNPEKFFDDAKNQVHLQCRKNFKLIDDLFKERLQSVSLVVTTLLTSLHDTTTENLNKGFKVATDSLEKITNSTEKILSKIDIMLEKLSDSPQFIILIVATSIILVGIIFGIVLELCITKLIKEMRTKIRDNTKVIKDLFSERWDRAKAMFMNQAREINIQRAREPQPTSEVLTFTLNGQSLNHDNLHGRNICFKP